MRRRLLPVLVLSGLLTGLSGGGGAAFDRLDFVVRGDDPRLERSLRDASILLTQQREKNNAAQDSFANARAEYGRLLSALYAEGHYSAVINIRIDGREAAGIAPLDAPDRIGVIEVTIDPGRRFTFGEIGVRPLARKTELPSGFKAGEPALSGIVAAAVTAGVEGWREQGHAKAAVAEEDVVADHPAALLSARIGLDPGPQLRFGALSVEGTERMREERVRKIAGLPEGERFSVSELNRAATRLRRTGVFSSVTLTEADVLRMPDLLDINIQVVEAPTRRYTFGAELATDAGLQLTGGWLHRNFFGGGERFEISGEVRNIGVQEGGMDYALDLTLSRPATPGPDTTAAVNLGIGRLDEEDYTANFATAGMTFTHVFSEELSARVGLDYDFLDGNDATGDFRYLSLSLPVGATWDRRDSKTDATKGFYIDAEAKPFLGFGTTDNGLRLETDLRGYKDFGERFVLAARVQVGAVLGSSLLGTPRDDLFYSGGGGTVRGQPYQSLGINVLRGLESLPIGGTHFLGGSLEARVKVTENIGVVGFFDVGQVGLGFESGMSETHSGAGVGVRYQTGFGPIRLDVATPVGGDTGNGVQIYVGLGQAF
jgi:translocation and assembly module TamA